MDGWISIHRKIQECWIWMDEPFSRGQAWVDLLLLVNHADKKKMVDGKLMTIKEGQRLTSIRQLAERWQWSRDKVARFLSILESDEMITVKKSHHYTLIEVTNYADYQGYLREEKSTKKPPIGHQSDTNRTQTDTNNNDNKENNNICAEFEKDFEALWTVYPKQKRKGKIDAKEKFVGYITTGANYKGKRYKFSVDEIFAGFNWYVEHENRGPEDDPYRYFKNFNTLMNQMPEFVEGAREDD